MQHPPQINPTKHAGQGTGSDVLACSCHSDYQDGRYGAGMRAMNRTKDGWRCTCGKVRTMTGGPKSKAA